MKRMMLVVALLLAAGLAIRSEAQDACAEFNDLVKQTYNFRDLHIPAAERAAKEKELDQFWTTVKAKKQAYLPCLTAGVKDPNSNPFFRFDGSNLLVEIDPSLASKTVQADVFMATDIDMVGARRWVTVLSYRGFDGIDISKAAEHWLDGVDKNAHYTIPEHGDFEVGPYEGGLFLYGSMEEGPSTPSLLKIVFVEACSETLTENMNPSCD